MFDIALNGGLTAPQYNLKTLLGGTGITDEGGQLATSGSNIFVFTADTTTTGVLEFRNVSTTADFEITNLSIRLIY